MSDKIQDKKININLFQWRNNLFNVQVFKIVKELAVPQFIKTYKISNFFKGKFYMKRLINRVFKYKLDETKSMSWSSSFWENVKIYKVQIRLKYNKEYASLNDFEIYVNNNIKNKRLKDIYRYKTLINKNKDISNALFITSECINDLGGNIDNNKIFLLDGTRRLIANVLLSKNKTYAFLISKK